MSTRLFAAIAAALRPEVSFTHAIREIGARGAGKNGIGRVRLTNGGKRSLEHGRACGAANGWVFSDGGGSDESTVGVTAWAGVESPGTTHPR